MIKEFVRLDCAGSTIVAARNLTFVKLTPRICAVSGLFFPLWQSGAVFLLFFYFNFDRASSGFIPRSVFPGVS